MFNFGRLTRFEISELQDNYYEENKTPEQDKADKEQEIIEMYKELRKNNKKT